MERFGLDADVALHTLATYCCEPVTIAPLSAPIVDASSGVRRTVFDSRAGGRVTHHTPTGRGS